MTISSENRKAGPYDGDGVTVDFPFSFKVFSASDVLVVLADANGVETELALTTDYTVALNADQEVSAGGVVTALTSPATGYTLTLSSQVQNLQPVAITNNGGFFPAVINTALDRLTILVQQLSERISRSLKLAISTPAGVSAELPAPVPYQVFGWDSTGTQIVNVDPSNATALSADLASTAAGKGAALVGFIQSGAGATPRTALAKLREFVSVKDFGAVGDGVTDDTAAVQAFFTALSTAGTNYSGGYIPAGNYLVTSQITWSGGFNKTLIFDGRIFGDFAAPILLLDTALWVSIINIKLRNDSTAAGARAFKVTNTYTSSARGGFCSGGEYAMQKQCNAFVFDNVEFSGATIGAGVGAAGNITANSFRGCVFQGNTTYGLSFDAAAFGNGVGKQNVEGCYFEDNPSGHIFVNASGHSLDICRNTFQFSSSHDGIVFGNVGSGLAASVRVYDNQFFLNGAYTVNGLVQASSSTMRLVRARGNVFAGTAGTTSMYGSAPYVIVEEAEALNNYLGVNNPDFAYDTAGVPDNWTNGGGAAAGVSATPISPYSCPGGKGTGRALTKTQQYVYQQITLRPNTLYRFSVWGAQNGAIEARMQIWNTAISSQIGSTGSGTNATTSATGARLDWYWHSGANTACRVLLRLSADAATASFSDFRVQDLTNS